VIDASELKLHARLLMGAAGVNVVHMASRTWENIVYCVVYTHAAYRMRCTIHTTTTTTTTTKEK
jgi:hypothetical protein